MATQTIRSVNYSVVLKEEPINEASVLWISNSDPLIPFRPRLRPRRADGRHRCQKGDWSRMMYKSSLTPFPLIESDPISP